MNKLFALLFVFVFFITGVYAFDQNNILLNMSFNNYTAIYNNSFAEDYSIYSNDGNVTNCSYFNNSLTNRYYGGYYFQNGASYINLSNTSTLQNISNNTNWTISFWMYSTDYASNRYIFFKDGAFGINHFNNNLRFTERKVGTQSYEAFDELTNSKWYHIVVTWNSERDVRANIYYNGKNQSITKSAEAVNIWNGSLGSLTIGRNSSAQGYVGYVDEVLIFNYTLSQEEIDQIYLSYKKDYFFSNDGDDNNICNNANEPCKTMRKLNLTPVFPGDNIYFKRGSYWRMPSDDFFDTEEGYTKNGYITYSNYGVGELPLFLGSVNGANTSCWTNNGLGDLWYWTCNKFVVDVGGINFNNDASIATNKTNYSSQINQYGEFAWNSTTGNLTINMSANPASIYSVIELYQATGTDDGLISPSNYNIIDGLHFKYGSYHGIANTNINNVIIKNNKVEWIGGAHYGSDKIVRYGNGIQIGLNATNISVLNNIVLNVWDAAASSQAWATGGVVVEENHLYQYNILGLSSIGFEFFNSLALSNTTNLVVDRNTFVNNGKGFAHMNSNEGDYEGRDLRLARVSRNSSGINITNNIFYNASSGSLNSIIDLGSSASYTWNTSIYFDNNLYFANDGLTHQVKWNGTNINTIANWSANKSQDLNHKTGDPLFYDILNLNFRPTNSSVCYMSSNNSYVGALPCYLVTSIQESAESNSLIIYSAFALLSLIVIIGSAWLIVQMFQNGLGATELMIAIASFIGLGIIILIGYYIISTMVMVI